MSDAQNKAERIGALIVVGLAVAYLAFPTYKHECGSGPASDPYHNLKKLFDAQARYFAKQGQYFVGPVKSTPGKTRTSERYQMGRLVS